MTLKPQSIAFGIILMSLGLAACGKGNAAKDPPSSSGSAAATDDESESASSQAAAASASGSTLADGPDVCFRAIAEHLGASTKVSEITSFFSAGEEIDSNASEPAGKMTTCTVEYQNPKDPRKLLMTRMDVSSGSFSEPQPVEITVMGGNESEFNLENYLIPLSSVNAAALTSVMDSQKAKLGGIYSRYAWSGVRLSAPGAFSRTHTLRLDLAGRLAANDIKKDGYASVTTDGKTITTNHLMP